MSISLKVYVYLLIDFSHYFATYIALAKETDFDPMGNQTHIPWVKSGTQRYWYFEEVYMTKWKSRFLAPAWQIENNQQFPIWANLFINFTFTLAKEVILCW